MIDINTESFKQAWSQAVSFARSEINKLPLPIEKKEEELKAVLVRSWADNFGLNDFWFFLNHVCGQQGFSSFFHGQLCDFLQSPRWQNKLVLAPRGHLKSTVGTIFYPIWRIVKNPNIRILIGNYRLENAKAFVKQMQNEFTANESFRTYFPNLLPDNMKDVKWNESMLTVKRDQNFKEATVEATGVGVEITGRHYDLIILDDVVGPENITTPEQRRKVIQWFLQLGAVLEPDGEIIALGTRWHFADLYNFIIENLTESDDWKVMRAEVFKADGTPLWPEKFTVEKIEKIKRKMEADPKEGRQLFVAQYLNKVIDDESATFKRGHMKFFTDADLFDEDGKAKKNLALSIVLDPAISERQHADRSAITVRGVDNENKWYILEVWADRVEMSVLIDKLFELYVKWNKIFPVDAVGVEAQSYQKALVYTIRDQMMNRNTFLPLVELLPGNVSKELRIRGLVPRWENGAILIRKNPVDNTDILVDEMLSFPKSAHDDAVDSLAYHSEIPIFAKRDTHAKPKVLRGRYGEIVEPQDEGYSHFFM